jgi:hypothetical protein
MIVILSPVVSALWTGDEFGIDLHMSNLNGEEAFMWFVLFIVTFVA